MPQILEGENQGLEECEVPTYQPTRSTPRGQVESQPGNYKAPGAPIKVFRCVRSQAGFSSLEQQRCKFGFVLAVVPFYEQLIYRELGIWLLIYPLQPNLFTHIF